ncbi:MAG: peptidyl-prolyl cis-trans isomerase, partial [Victivallales bacterium]
LCSLEFKEKEYKIPQQYVEDMLDGLAANMAGGDRKKLEKKALAEGLTLNDLRMKAHEKIAVDILVFEFCYRNVFITPREVNDYYQKNAGEFSKAPQIELQVLLLKKDGKFKDEFDGTLEKIKPDAAKADKEIFTTLVKLYSEGPDVAKGGNIGWLEESKLRPEFAAAIKCIGNASVTGPVQADEGVYFIRISDRMGAKSKAFEDVRDEISEKLTKVEKEKRYNDYMNRLKEKAVIRYFIDE